MTRSILSKQSRKQKQDYKSIWENKDKDIQSLIGFISKNGEHVRLSKQMGHAVARITSLTTYTKRFTRPYFSCTSRN